MGLPAKRSAKKKKKNKKGKVYSKRTVAASSEPAQTDVRLYRQGDDPLLYDMARAKLVVAIVSQRPPLGMGIINSHHVLNAVNSLTQHQSDPDAVMVLCVETSGSALRCKLQQPVSVRECFRVRGYALGTVVEWKTSTTLERAFELEMLCCDSRRKGIGRRLVLTVEQHVRDRHPLLGQIFVHALFPRDPPPPDAPALAAVPFAAEIRAFYEAMGYAIVAPAIHKQEDEFWEPDSTWMRKQLQQAPADPNKPPSSCKVVLSRRPAEV